jgi:integrase
MRARELRQRIDRGENPIDDRTPSPATASIATVLDDFIARYARNPRQPLRQRTGDDYESMFNRLVKPRIGKVGIYDIRRSHIVKMLDEIEDANGPVAADRTLACVRKAFNWYATRDDQFNVPVVRGMARIRPKQRTRSRVLSDDEIRTIWPLLDAAGTFGAMVKVLLLTAQRRDEVAGMAFSEIGADGIWAIPAERYKTGHANFVPLSKAALDVIAARPAYGSKYVFASGAGTPFSGFSKSKKALDRAVSAAAATVIPNWTLHDLRRTAKTLMSRAGVRPDISERVLGHVIAGVEGVYDRHSYLTEKRDALEKLAEQIDRILNPLPANVTSLADQRPKP